MTGAGWFLRTPGSGGRVDRPIHVRVWGLPKRLFPRQNRRFLETSGTVILSISGQSVMGRTVGLSGHRRRALAQELPTLGTEIIGRILDCYYSISSS